MSKARKQKTPEDHAFDVFRFSVKKVEGYKKFIEAYGINPKKIVREKSFSSIPVMDKKNYLLAYNRMELVPEGKFPLMVSASSGSSGKPYYWPRGEEHERWGGEMHTRIIRDIFRIKNKKVLAIVCFSMGNWVAGTFSLASLKHVAKNYTDIDLTIITPGIDKEDAVIALRDFAPDFDTVILMGYPPFVMDVVTKARYLNIDLNKLDLYFILAGENFSEKWRSVLMKNAGVLNKGNRVVAIYGTADACALGHENPFTMFVRQEALKNKKFKKDLIGETTFTPTIVSYYPDKTYFEMVNGELVFTTKSGIPLVRYNIKDHGLVLPSDYIISLLKKHNLYKSLPDKIKKWKDPVIILKGRNDVLVTFYALNIYPENLKAGLEDDRLINLVTGKYIISVDYTEDFKKQKLMISVELQKGVSAKQEIKELVTTSIVENLSKLNTEYRKLYRSLNTKAVPHITLLEYGHDQFLIKKAKHKWIKKEV